MKDWLAALAKYALATTKAAGQSLLVLDASLGPSGRRAHHTPASRDRSLTLIGLFSHDGALRYGVASAARLLTSNLVAIDLVY